MILEAQLIDLHLRQIYPVALEVEDQKIKKITKINPKPGLPYLLPGFIDAHVHIESSMLVPSEFARIAVKHGTVATISDPHEIANVLGVAGVDYMIENATQFQFHFYFGAPSCVPSTNFETAGAIINSRNIDALLSKKEITFYLNEILRIRKLSGVTSKYSSSLMYSIHSSSE